MATSLIIADSWDHYGPTQAVKWTSGSPQSIDLTGTKSRTGIGCLILGSGSGGPYQLFSPATKVSGGSAFYPDGLPATGYADIWQWADAATDNRNVRVCITSTGAVAIVRGNDPFGVILGTSAPGIMVPSLYNYVECYAEIAISAVVVVKVNGAIVLALSGVNTITVGANPWVDRVQLTGIGLFSSRHDDTRFDDPVLSPFAMGFRGCIRIYASVPFADSSPAAWTPSAGGTSFNMVDEIPPDDDTTYISSATVGQATQMLFNAAGVPANSQIQTVQHVQDLKLDAAGARSVASECNGVVNASSAVLTTSYHMYRAAYDLNPLTGLPWVGGDFPAAFGPAVTA